MQERHWAFIMIIKQFMLFRELITLCSKNYTQYINAWYVKITEFVKVNRGGTFCNHCALKG
jgi:hypothetical protein